MGNRDYLSEQALATLTCARFADAEGHVLIGGLGMGFTLGAALAAWSATSSFVVAELVPSVVAWSQGPLAHLSGIHLADPRVSLKLVDVHDEISDARDRYDAILLDVDNGPEGFIKLENDRLYCNWGLREAYAALRPKGILAIWSAFPMQHSSKGWKRPASMWTKPSCRLSRAASMSGTGCSSLPSPTDAVSVSLLRLSSPWAGLEYGLCPTSND